MKQQVIYLKKDYTISSHNTYTEVEKLNEFLNLIEDKEEEIHLLGFRAKKQKVVCEPLHLILNDSKFLE
ncbi:MAG: hypothetical protein RQ952_04425 [Thermoproteota archaeon]|jgi:hypothetical protein|nr:hypothetical protein [Thermoproteota archaeon]